MTDHPQPEDVHGYDQHLDSLSAQDESDGMFIAVEKYDAVVADLVRLVAAIEDYALWEPGRAGHAAAHRKLMEEARRVATR